MENRILERLETIGALVLDRLDTFGARLARVEATLEEMRTGKKKEVSDRAKRYREQKKRQEQQQSALLRLPEQHMLRRRDPRLHEIHGPVLEAAFQRFAALDKPFLFARWVAWYWNSCVYKKRPVAFSAGYFQVWIGTVRNRYGPFDLMGYKKKTVLLRNDGEHDDFRNRPWWDWCYHVIMPLTRKYKHLRGDDLKIPEHFDRCMRLVLGDMGEYEVYTGQYWGQSEDMSSINKMLKKVSGDLFAMWEHFLQGLRSKLPIPIPE